MSTATAADDLTWVTFGGGNGKVCAVRHQACTAEAVAVAVFQVGCECAPDRQPRCADHRRRLEAFATTHGGRCHCANCYEPSLLLRIEPIR